MELPKDPIILELYEEFVEHWILDINEQFDGFVESKNTTDFYRFAHTLKGSGYQFEIAPLGDVGIELMSLIREENWEPIPPFKEKLLAILAEAKQCYNDNMKITNKIF
jgi:chemotaxis protein histidine kinase CheA